MLNLCYQKLLSIIQDAKDGGNQSLNENGRKGKERKQFSQVIRSLH